MAVQVGSSKSNLSCLVLIRKWWCDRVCLPTAYCLQAKRLDELEKLYKDEQVSRKRYFNMMEDMKGERGVGERSPVFLGGGMK